MHSLVVVLLVALVASVQPRQLHQDLLTGSNTTASLAHASISSSRRHLMSGQASSGSSGSSSPLKILVESSRLYDLDSELSPSQADKLLKEYMTVAVSRVTKALQLRGPVTSGPLSQEGVNKMKRCAQRGKLGAVPAGLDSSKRVGNANFILLVVSSKKHCTERVMAGCGVCVLDSQTDRPRSGIMNVCPLMFENLLGRLTRDEVATNTLTHELMHCLGFHDGAMYFWRNPDTGKPYEKVFQDSSSAKKPAWLLTPRVKSYAKAYFGCNKLPGGPVDHFDDNGLHWWTPALPNELMVASGDEIDISLAVLSRFTLAAMEDTGWYIPNYKAAQAYTSNKGAGCKLFGL